MSAGAALPLRFPRAMRIKHGHEFRKLKEHGQRLARGCLAANWMVLPADAFTHLGVITSRKLGGAVVRSRARRLLRETFRRHQNELRQPLALVLVARSSIVGKMLPAVERDFLWAMRQAGLLKQTE